MIPSNNRARGTCQTTGIELDRAVWVAALMRVLLPLGLAGSLVLLALAGPIASAQPVSSTSEASHGGIQIRDVTRLIPASGRAILLEVNKGTLVHLAQPASTVFVANPDIADVQVKSPKLIYITAKSPGETVIYAVDADDNVLVNAPIRVSLDLSNLRQSLQSLVPDASIAADSVGSKLVLTGSVADAGAAEKAVAVATAIAGEVKGGQVVNRMSIATPNQVNLRVLLAEVDKNVLKQIGVDWSRLAGTVTFATHNNPALVNQITIGQTIGNAANATISALETEGFLTVLAQPNLTAVSGQTASFLAGGEYPIPVLQSSTGATGNAITIQYQPYGVQLAFTPTIVDSDHLSLRVRPEVSQLSPQGAVTISGFSIPALTVRRAETTVDLASGESFALAGLMQHTTEQDISKVPWIGDIPILGALFRSNKFQNNESELVILVTPYLVRPSAQPLANPVAGLQVPNDAQQVFLNDTYRQKLSGPPQGPVGAGGRGLIGPAGFQLN
jgi:pilus assembly protein CpaC